MNSNAKWEMLEIKSNMEHIPLYSGLVQIKPKQYLILGGMIKDKYISQCYKFDLDNNTFSEDNEYKLPNKEKFNGKKFNDLGRGFFGEFSMLHDYYLYRVDSNSKKIDIIEYK